MGLIAWVKKLLTVVREHEADVETLTELINARANDLYRRVEQAEKLIRDRTTVDVDVGFSGGCTVIVTGRYRDADYVNVHTIRPEDFRALVELLREMERFANLRHIDAAPEFRATLRRGLKSWG